MDKSYWFVSYKIGDCVRNNYFVLEDDVFHLRDIENMIDDSYKGLEKSFCQVIYYKQVSKKEYMINNQ